MAWSLFLDDERSPRTERDWVIARTHEAAAALCRAKGCPAYVSFDHDLGDGPSGHDFAHWLIERDMDEPGFIPAAFDFNVHSANVVGRANIEGLLSLYLGLRKAA
jgi:hypothetical protein